MTLFEIHPTCGHDYTADIDTDRPDKTGHDADYCTKAAKWLNTICCPMCPRLERIEDLRKYCAALKSVRPLILPHTAYDVENGRELGRRNDTIWPAKLKCQRERMGLPTKWLAERWKVAEYSIQRWERSRAMPAEFSEDWVAMLYDYGQQIDTYSRRDVIIVPRVNTDSLVYPAAFYRSAGLDAHKATGAPIEYGDVPITDIVIKEPQDMYGSLMRELRLRREAEHADGE